MNIQRTSPRGFFITLADGFKIELIDYTNDFVWPSLSSAHETEPSFNFPHTKWQTFTPKNTF